MNRRSFSCPNKAGMSSGKRKLREDDQDEDSVIFPEAKKQQIKVEDVWSSSSEECITVQSEVDFSKGETIDSDLDSEEVFDGSRRAEGIEAVFDQVHLSSEDVSSFEENEGQTTPGSSGKENLGGPSWKSQCLPQPPPDWLLTPPSLGIRNKDCKLLSSEAEFSSRQESPLPTGLGWADPTEVWDLMVSKDKLWKKLRDCNLFSIHPSLEPRMRAILLDWIIEVCEVYKLHRETYYLAQDYIDRFLSAQKDVPKQQLQLIGITCLFIAAKIEEIYPPKIGEFAYVTDGACDENEILDKELIILKALCWVLSPVTVNTWLSIYLQLYGHDSGLDSKEGIGGDEKSGNFPWEFDEEGHSWNNRRSEFLEQMRRACRKCGRRRGCASSGPLILLKPPPGSSFVFPQFPGIALARAAHLADFATLDAQSLRFPYSVIAASTLCLVWSKEVALTVSGHRWADLKPCVEWMSAFAITLKEAGAMSQLESQLEAVWARLGLGLAAGDSGNRGAALLRTIPHLVADDSHNIQTHLVDLDLLEKAQEKLSRLSAEQVPTSPLDLRCSGSSSPSSREAELSSPATSMALLTPPASSVKSSSTSSSHGNISVTPNTPTNPYHSADFCVG